MNSYHYFLHYKPETGKIIAYTMHTRPQLITAIPVEEGEAVIGVEIDHPAIAEPALYCVQHGQVEKKA